MKVGVAFVTGSAGFIGFHVCRNLLSKGWKVNGYDALNDYYDVSLKKSRLQVLEKFDGSFHNTVGRLEDSALLQASVEDAQPNVIIHLAAQGGVR